jgi:hypothetical protein
MAPKHQFGSMMGKIFRFETTNVVEMGVLLLVGR